MVADYTRFSRDRRSAFFGVGIGYLLPTLFQFGFGSILVLSRDVDPNRPRADPDRDRGRRVRRGVLALLALTVDETDEAFANVYSAAVSTQNLFPRIPQRALIVGASVVATAGALAIDMRSYQRFLLLLGAVFVPLLGVLIADWLLAALTTRGPTSSGPAFRPANIVAWLAGFLVYEWLNQPAELGFWSRWVSHLPAPSYQFGASVPSFAVAFCWRLRL